MKNRLFLSTLLQILMTAAAALAQTAPFTYQGRLLDGGQSANGSYDLRFTLADAATNGNYIAGPLTNAPVLVSNGLFAVTLDFGASVFGGSARWLEIGVRTNGSSGPYVVLIPRQAITATPYATFANAAATAGVAANLTPGATITVNGAGITNLNGANMQSGSVGTNQLNGWVNGQLALATQPGLLPGTRLTNSLFIDSNSAVLYPMSDGSGGTNYLPLGTVVITNMGGFENYGNAGSNYLALIFSNAPNYSKIMFAGINGNDASLWFWPSHGESGYGSQDPRAYDAPELLIDCAGSICLSWGWGSGGQRALQHGVQYQANLWEYMQASGYPPVPLPWNTNCGSSVPVLGTPQYWSGSNWLNANSGGAPLSYSGWQILARDTNSDSEMVFYDYFDTSVSGRSFNWASKSRMRILFGQGGGLDLRGKLVLEHAPAITTSSSAIALDFNSAQCIDLIPTQGTVSFYATNTSGMLTGGNTNFEQRVFILRANSGNIVGSFPTNWSWLTAPVATITNGTLVRLQLESIGTGQSNILASAQYAVNYNKAP